MPDDTTILSLPLILPAQAQKHVTHNEALAMLDVIVQLSVLDRDRTEPPALPSMGDRHIVAAGAIAGWAGQSGRIAQATASGWSFTAPLPGWIAFDRAAGAIVAFDGLVWAPTGGAAEMVPHLGINATADAVNRLSVAADATLLDHDGAGHQLKINKAGAGDTASLLFQTGFSGRAEMGTMGNNAFAIKVSDDGAAFTTALSADGATGILSAPEGFTSAGFQLRDATDATRRAAFDLSGLTAGVTRTLSLPNTSSELAALGGAQTFNGSKTFSGTFTVSAATATFGGSTNNATYGFGSGATASGNSKTVSLGTGGLSGSVTSVVIGPTIAGATGSTVIHGTSVAFGPGVSDFDMGAASARGGLLGLGGATADSTNRLSVNAAGVLFNHAGSGTSLALNKAATGQTADLSWKTGFSARAMMGLLGNDSMALRVSPDGSTFHNALTADPATGQTTFGHSVVLGGLAADPATPADGTVWHNSTTGQIRGRIGGATIALDGQQSVAWLTPPAAELVQTTIGAGGGATGTLAGASNRLDLFPFVPRAEISIDRLFLNCTTAVAAALAKLVVYSADAAGRPASLITETADIDLSTTGAKFAAASLTLLPGRVYWLGVRHSSTATVSAWAVTATPDINGGTTPVTTARKVLRRTLTYATAAPTTWAFTSTEIQAGPATAIWLRIA